MSKQLNKKYKYLRPEQVEELAQLSPEELIAEYLKSNKSVKFLVQEKKDDQNLIQLKKDIKLHRDNNTPDKVKQLKLEIKDIKKEVDEEIRDQIDEVKDIEGGYKDSINSFKERINVIMRLIDQKTEKKK